MNRFSIMERHWIGGFMRLVIMDWEKAEIITLMAHELDEENLDNTLVSYINDMLPILEKPLWKSNKPDMNHPSNPLDSPNP
jgi:hypothetical protein